MLQDEAQSFDTETRASLEEEKRGLWVNVYATWAKSPIDATVYRRMT
jgi:hypothetical protein